MRITAPRIVLVSALAASLALTACSDEVFWVGDQGIGKKDRGGKKKDAFSPDTRPALPKSYKPYKCNKPGKSCNAHDPCAFNPVCGQDNKCWPEYLMDCNDKLGCTVDKCLGLGMCSNIPKKGFCRVMYRVGIDDGGVPVTVPKCVAIGTRKPDDPCMGCQPSQGDGGVMNNTKWMPMSGGSCNDKDDCTMNDVCIGGTCKGTSFLKQCADQFGCTKDLCDGKGGCLGNKLMAGWCIIDNTCYKKGGKKPDGSCFECDPSKSTKQWTAISNTCKIDGKCYNKGDFNGGKCAVCDPAFSKTSWKAVAGRCLIDKVCKKPGDLDAIKCATCNPNKNKYKWSPLSGVCKINGKCYSKGAKHPLGCAECDPAKSGTSWTVKGNFCLINNKCYNPKVKDSIKCGTCEPTKAKYKWTQIPGLCKISGTCYNKGAQHPGKCASCQPGVSATSWTVGGATYKCLINNVCKNPGAKDLSGCSQCAPKVSKYKWTALANTCKIDGACYQSGDKHNDGCAVCNATASKTSWTPTGNKCIIDGDCENPGTKDGSGCGVCDPNKAKKFWSVASNSCIVGPNKCVPSGTKEPGGCGECKPAKTKHGWTKPTGCGAVHRWSKKFGGSSSDYAYAVDVDANGNVYVAGYFYSSIMLGGQPHGSKGSYDIFLASYTPSGQLRWGKTFGSSSSDIPYDLEVDNAGNVYITGRIYNSVNFGGQPLQSKGSYDIFIASFTSAGKHRWSKNFGGTSSDYGYGLAVDGSGNVYITGYTYGTVNFGGTNLTTSSGDMFLASYTPSGVHRWSKVFGGTSSDYGYALATDKSGNVYLTGYFYNSINFGGSAITSNGSYDTYVASFTSGGSHRWSHGIGSTSSDYGYGIATDNKGNVYFTGMFYNSLKLPGGTTLASKGSYDAFVVSLNATGSLRWARSMGANSSDYGRKIAVGSGGAVLVAGDFYYTVDFGGGNLTASSRDGYLVKLIQ